MSNNQVVYDIHAHSFTEDDVPRNFLPLGLVSLLSRDDIWGVLGKVMHSIIPFSDADIVDRYRRFVEISKYNTQREIFDILLEQYPSNVKIVILPMNMSYMSAGSIPRPYIEQLNELAKLRDVYPNNIIPFYMADPRDPKMVYLFKYAVEELGFKGVKLYPALGYYPYDERLSPIYEYLSEHNMPIITHCSKSGPVYFRGSKAELKKLIGVDRSPLVPDWKTNMIGCQNFGHPTNYMRVMTTFPKVKICVAHSGGDEEWDRMLDHGYAQDNWTNTILTMMPEYPNFYSDISFTAHKSKFWPRMKTLIDDSIIGSRLLYGTDYYMSCVSAANMSVFTKEFRNCIGESRFTKIATTNPMRFMNEA